MLTVILLPLTYSPPPIIQNKFTVPLERPLKGNIIPFKNHVGLYRMQIQMVNLYTGYNIPQTLKIQRQ